MPELLHVSDTFANYNCPIREADVVFLGVPFTATSMSTPAIYGSLMVREALKIMSGNYKNFDIFDRLKFADVGDLDIAWGSYEITAKRLRETIRQILEINGKVFPVFVGGEHLISLPIAEALKPKTIIQFDAHSDIYKNVEEVAYSHGTWAYHASKFAKLIQIGVVDYDDEEMDAVKENGVTIFNINDDISMLKMERPVHISIDIDVFSPELVETGHPEGTMRPEQVFAILEKIKCDSLDICEIADDRVPSKTGLLAGQTMKRVLYTRFANG